MKRKPFRMPQIDILEAKADQNLNQQMQLYSKYPESKLLCKKAIFPDEFSPPKLMIPYAHHKKTTHTMHPHINLPRRLRMKQNQLFFKVYSPITKYKSMNMKS